MTNTYPSNLCVPSSCAWEGAAMKNNIASWDKHLTNCQQALRAHMSTGQATAKWSSAPQWSRCPVQTDLMSVYRGDSLNENTCHELTACLFLILIILTSHSHFYYRTALLIRSGLWVNLALIFLLDGGITSHTFLNERMTDNTWWSGWRY